MTQGRRRLGIAGEDKAAEWYAGEGYRVVARNWRCRDGELDLVLVGHGSVVFSEVKTRSSTRFGVPAESVSATKQRRIRGLATRFLQENPEHHGRIRFDVVSILSGKLHVIEAAF